MRNGITINLSLFLLPFFAMGQVSNTVHNMSSSGPGQLKSFSEEGVCIFCHTTHVSTPMTPDWDKKNPGTTYILYDRSVSSTIQSAPGQPDGSSILCLSCHDGTIALGNLNRSESDLSFGGNATFIPLSENTNLSTDLSDDHPVSFVYNSSLAISDGQLKDPETLEFPVMLDYRAKMQCTSCHNPHQNDNEKFLVATKRFSKLCFSCHERDNWSNTGHSSSNAGWNGSGKNPWAHIDDPFPSVAENGCENCHDQHGAAGRTRLLKSQYEENICLDCHNGNVATTDIETQLAKSYSHNVFSYNTLHDPSEDALARTIHVECQDCHNPHSSRSSDSRAPYVKGVNENVPGVDQSGNPVLVATFEYEICYRCHSDSHMKPPGRTTRQLGTDNVREDFGLENISYHPVVQPRNNSSITSLIAPYSVGSMIYCTDCHASDGNTVAGPHGSIYPQLLKARLNRTLTSTNELTDNTDIRVEFALCAICHDMAVVENRHSTMYSGHILRKTSCVTCHDPHGFPGGNTENNSFLLNFDTKIISVNINGDMYIKVNGDNSGICNLKCHSHDHVGSTYSRP